MIHIIVYSALIFEMLILYVAPEDLRGRASGDFNAGTPRLLGDFDNDGDVDSHDYLAFHGCFVGPDASAPVPCMVANDDEDLDIDLDDFATFQLNFGHMHLAICGNGQLESGEQCDDGDAQSGDGCSPSCVIEPDSVPNDDCVSAQALADGSFLFSNLGATTDGPDEPLECNFYNYSNIRSDIWYCYTATCTGEADFSLCGSAYDTKMAVYAGCQCPDAGPADDPLGCSDDKCGLGVDNVQSRVSIQVTAGQTYMVRVGGFVGNREQGKGRLTIRCGIDICSGALGSCTTDHGANQPGCNDAACCNEVCEVDTFCCDVTWDSFCASQAGGYCSQGGFPSCGSAGSCTTVHAGAGCSPDSCCEAVCATDPYCCISSWDQPCVQAATFCGSCDSRRGPCTEPRNSGGCNDMPCCVRTCLIDEFCCTTMWDQACVEQAQELCP